MGVKTCDVGLEVESFGICMMVGMEVKTFVISVMLPWK